MNLKEMDIKGKARIRINTLITRMDVTSVDAVLKYTEDVYELFELKDELQKDDAQDVKSEIESYEGEG